MALKILTVGELLLKAGFAPETGNVIFQWTVRFQKVRHKDGCGNFNDDDWCSCPHFEKVIKRIVPWESILFKTSVSGMAGGFSWAILEWNDLPRDRHRSIELDIIAEDANAVYSLQDYDGDQWMEKIPKRAKDILKVPGSFKYDYEKFERDEEE